MFPHCICSLHIILKFWSIVWHIDASKIISTFIASEKQPAVIVFLGRITLLMSVYYEVFGNHLVTNCLVQCVICIWGFSLHNIFTLLTYMMHIKYSASVLRIPLIHLFQTRSSILPLWLCILSGCCVMLMIAFGHITACYTLNVICWSMGECICV